MAQDKLFNRIERKLDALLKKSGLNAEDFSDKQMQQPEAEKPLTDAEREAINNAPKTPIAKVIVVYDWINIIWT